MSCDFEFAISEIGKYKSGVHQLNKGIDEDSILSFETKFQINIPVSYREWLKKYNGGELFALPAGTCFFGILGESKERNECLYLEDNFDNKMRSGMGVLDSNLFIIAQMCDNELIAFDSRRTSTEDGCVVQYDHDLGEIVHEWDGFEQWLNSIFTEQEGTWFDYDGNEK